LEFARAKNITAAHQVMRGSDFPDRSPETLLVARAFQEKWKPVFRPKMRPT
jgi:hypothetical protein